MKQLACIVAQYPAVTETFIAREIEELCNQGRPVLLFACRKGAAGGASARPTPSRPAPPQPDLSYQPRFASRAAARATAYFLVRRPGRFISTLLYVAWKCRRRPLEALRILHNAHGAAFFAKLVLERGVRHIHAHFLGMPSTIALIASRLADVPFSVSVHAWDLYVGPVMLEEKMKRARFIVTCTEYNRKYLGAAIGGRFDDKMRRIYHGLDPSRYAMAEARRLPAEARARSAWRLLAVGRLIPKKGFECLVEACALLQGRGYGFSCTIIGEGELHGRLRGMIEAKGLRGAVALRAFVSPEELIEEYRKADVLVCPSIIAADGDRDGLPNVILEAMALGVPVVASGISGIPEALEDRRSGMVVPEKRPDKIAEAVLELMQDAALRARIVSGARKNIERSFDIRRNVADLIACIDASAGPVTARERSMSADSL